MKLPDSEVYLYSNAGEIYRFFPYVKPLQGAILGVGSDQVLDIFANTQLRTALLVDRSEVNCSQMSLMLSVGLLLKEDLKHFPTPEEFLNSFKRENFRALEPRLIEILGRRKVNQGRVLVDSWLPIKKGQEEGSLKFVEYMQLRAILPDEEGLQYAWYSTPDKLKKVLKAFDEERIIIQNANFLEKDDILDLRLILEDMDTGGIDCLYLSNIEQALERQSNEGALNRLWDNLSLLPISQDALILRTAMTGIPQSTRIQSRVTQNHPVFKQICYRWHYNIEEMRHRRAKVLRDSSYNNLGWIIGVLAETVLGKARITGLSYLSLDRNK